MGTSVNPPTMISSLFLLFITGYLVIFKVENPVQKEAMLKYLNELMAKTVIHGWEPVQVFHAIWFQQLENGCANW